ncbi:hypothetical protein SAMN05421812_106391 [Asanoa hainanensis]|uniref:Calcineurin-like phosphoesterase domain-containing protein n=1 Tax=Asanoa hainanensis TaxID=560556 RepID=A0A239MUP4_9ACTN|nr:metallophosphoesterase [Asanoa hainanensis]SNT46527.1 hypothetical protein SAMN05421812_106391 [Asanoa hainanensis]
MGIVLLVVVAFAVIALIHFYIWKRLVRDATRPGLVRRVGAVLAVVLGLLVPATLIGTRTGATVLAWPGYLWIALMFYLLVVLLVLEIPMLLVRIALRRSTAATAEAAPAAGVPGGPAAMATPAQTATTTRPRGADHPERPAVTSTSTATTAEAPPREGAQEQPAAASTATAAAPPSRQGAQQPAAASTATAATAPPREAAQGLPAAVTTTTAPAAPPREAAQEQPAPAPATATATAPPHEGAQGQPAAGTNTTAEPAAQDVGPRGIERRLLLARGAAIFAGLTATGITAYGARTALSAPRLDRVQITLAKLPRSMDGFRIATVSDIHLGPLAGRAHTERVVAAINRTQADIVAVVGDLVDGSVAELGGAAAPLRGIQSKNGAFFVTGNHEYYSGAEEWLAEVERLGIRTLRNQRQLITARGGAIDLAGVNDIAGEGTSTGGPDIAGTLKDRDPGIPVVLLAHQPIQVHDAADNNVDLQLSGHTHGGQMVPFNLLVKLEQPVVNGYARFGDTQLYVTNGAGFWGPPVRVGAPPQVTLVELRSP